MFSSFLTFSCLFFPKWTYSSPLESASSSARSTVRVLGDDCVAVALEGLFGRILHLSVHGGFFLSFSCLFPKWMHSSPLESSSSSVRPTVGVFGDDCGAVAVALEGVFGRSLRLSVQGVSSSSVRSTDVQRNFVIIPLTTTS